MAGQVLLQVEVGQLLSRVSDGLLVILEKFLELVVGENETTILLGLKVVGPDIGSNLLGHIRASHQGATLAAEEDRKLIANLGRLHKPTRCAIALVLVFLCVELVEDTKLLGHVLLHQLHLHLERTQLNGEVDQGTIQVGEHITDGGHLGGHGVSLNWLRSNRGRNRDWGWNLDWDFHWNTLWGLRLGLL